MRAGLLIAEYGAGDDCDREKEQDGDGAVEPSS
jgi:hypothetical protein